MKLIRNWEELLKVPANDNFRIVVDEDMCSGHIETLEGFYIAYLNTHTFYSSQCKTISKLLQRCGFNIELDNWDKEGEK